MPKRKQSPAQLANLIPATKKTARELGRRGAIAANKAKAEKRTIQQEMKIALDTLIKNSKGEEITVRSAIVLAQIKKALNGDSKAFDNCGEYSAEKPAEQKEITIKEPRKFVFELKK